MTKAELKRAIEIADRVLWETRDGKSYSWVKGYFWLQGERARLVHELRQLEGKEIRQCS
jgi:hypothetical protein